MSQPLVFVLGTRPEIIKLAPVILLAQEQTIPFCIIHTNQHYSQELDQIFFEELGLPAADYNLNVGAGSQNIQTACMIERLDPILQQVQPKAVIVQGDTNSVLAGALAAVKLDIPVAHIEAGLRSYDRGMPEETNRIVTDHISTYLFPPTDACHDILRREGIDHDQVLTVGNTIVDAVIRSQEKASLDMLQEYGVEEKEYFLLTLHRPSNVDTKKDLEESITFVDKIAQHYSLPVIFPAHLRTKNALEKFSIELPATIRLIEPVGYMKMLALQKYARAVMTDSGGVQEESCILGVPCLTMRTSTERPETNQVGANALVYRDSEKAIAAIDSIQPNSWQNPFGDGQASQRILSALE